MLEVRIATGFDDLRRVWQLRGAAFVRDDAPYDEEFDGNDLACCTHLLAMENDVPKATMRLRFISHGVVAWERVCIKRGTSDRALFGIYKHARRYCEAKGAVRAIGCVADRRLMKYWQRMGAARTPEGPIVYSNIAYWPVSLDLRPDDAPPSDIDFLRSREADFVEFAVSAR